MLPNAFIGQAAPPTDDELAAALGRTKKLWDRIVTELAAEQDVTNQEWKSYSKKWGWSMKVLRKSRNILFLSPCAKQFTASFIFGAKAFELAKPLLPNPEEAKKYPEGTGVAFDVKTVADVELVKRLAAIKLAN